MITGIHHVGLSVRSLGRTLDGLSGALPLEVVRRFSVAGRPEIRELTGLADVHAEGVLIKGPNGYLQLFDFKHPDPAPALEKPVNTAGITHICIQGRDIETLRHDLMEGGATFHAPPTDLGTGFLYAYGRSADGNVVETEGAPFAPGDLKAWIGHVAFATHDLDRLSGFYSTLCGVAAVTSRRLRGDARYDEVTGLKDVDVRAAWVVMPNLGLEFWQYLNPPTTPAPTERPVNDLGYSYVCLETDDLDRDRDRAVALWARPLGGTVEGSCARAASLRDPDGNVLALIQWTAGGAGMSIADLEHTDILERVKAARP